MHIIYLLKGMTVKIFNGITNVREGIFRYAYFKTLVRKCIFDDFVEHKSHFSSHNMTKKGQANTTVILLF